MFTFQIHFFGTDTRDAEIDETDVHDRVFGQEYLAIYLFFLKSQTTTTINDYYDGDDNNIKKKQSRWPR